MINAVAVMFGVRWDAVKNAVVRRIKIDDEETEKHGPIWTIIPRSKRCDAYELKGLNLMCHDDNIFRFSSRRSEPLREHVGVGEYKIHWACEVPNEMQDVVQIYLHDPRAVQYLELDKANNGGNIPERTTIIKNICFCLVKPTYDQCADPARLLCAPCKRTSPRQSSYLPAWRE
mmetsp:Transcript_14561/g.34487  ORF Transcript_14561/g.34487 Transcript_14561/m.34487 type:complete len:174 (-) Transcript_14561:356-877(-)